MSEHHEPPTPADRQTRLPIALDGAGRFAFLLFPRNLTRAEAQRIAHIVSTLGLEDVDDAPPPRAHCCRRGRPIGRRRRS